MIVKGFLFDMDGVVIDSERYSDIANNELLKEYGHVYNVTKIKPLIAGIPEIDGANLLAKYYHLPISGEEFD